MNSEIREEEAQYLEGNDFLCRQSDHIIKAFRISFSVYSDMLSVHQQAIKIWGNISGCWAKLFYACQIHIRV